LPAPTCYGLVTDMLPENWCDGFTGHGDDKKSTETFCRQCGRG